METIEQLPDTARGLWNVLKRTRAWLPENTGEQYWMLGGGTLLAARWRGQGPPRQNEDLDIKIRAPTHERAEEARKRLQIAALERAFANAGGARCRPEQEPEERSQKHRDALRAQGLRPVQIWVPDTRAEGFADECARQVAQAADTDRADPEVMSFVDVALEELVELGD